MRRRVLGKATNKYEIFVADSNTSVSIIPINVAKRKGIKWGPVNQDEPNYSGVTLGYVNFSKKSKIIKHNPEKYQVLLSDFRTTFIFLIRQM